MATTRIEGTVDFEDAGGRGTNITANFGGTTQNTLRSTNQVNYIQVATSAIPAGNITSAIFSLNFRYVGVTSGPDIVAHRFVDSNVWVEGSTNGAPENGASCWQQRLYDATIPVYWAGGANGGVIPTTDYDISPSGALTKLGGGRHYMDIPAVWFTDWRDVLRVNNGFVLHMTENVRSDWYSSERSAGPWIDLEVSAGPTGHRHYYDLMGMQ